MSRVNGRTYTRSLTHSHRNKSIGVKSEDLGGHAVGPPRPIHLSGNVLIEEICHRAMVVGCSTVLLTN
jgi:hypothetical protein